MTEFEVEYLKAGNMIIKYFVFIYRMNNSMIFSYLKTTTVVVSDTSKLLIQVQLLNCTLLALKLIMESGSVSFAMLRMVVCSTLLATSV